jgi:hypothetical protein
MLCVVECQLHMRIWWDAQKEGGGQIAKGGCVPGDGVAVSSCGLVWVQGVAGFQCSTVA